MVRRGKGEMGREDQAMLKKEKKDRTKREGERGNKEGRKGGQRARRGEEGGGKKEARKRGVHFFRLTSGCDNCMLLFGALPQTSTRTVHNSLGDDPLPPSTPAMHMLRPPA